MLFGKLVPNFFDGILTSLGVGGWLYGLIIDGIVAGAGAVLGFVPQMLVATGCGVPGIMASRTTEQDRDRKMTIMTTGFIPCGAKMPIIGLFAGEAVPGIGTIAAVLLLAGMLYLLFRRGYQGEEPSLRLSSVAAAR